MEAIKSDKLLTILPMAIVAIALIMRLTIRRLPGFLDSRAG
jgi:hypothetical protein